MRKKRTSVNIPSTDSYCFNPAYCIIQGKRIEIQHPISFYSGNIAILSQWMKRLGIKRICPLYTASLITEGSCTDFHDWDHEKCPVNRLSFFIRFLLDFLFSLDSLGRYILAARPRWKSEIQQQFLHVRQLLDIVLLVEENEKMI